MSRTAQIFICVAVALLAVLSCLFVGYVLVEGIEDEEREARFEQKQEFFEAIRQNDADAVRDMLQKDPRLANETLAESPEEYEITLCDDTPLIASSGRAEIMRMLLDFGADVNKQTPITGRYPLASMLTEDHYLRYNDADLMISRGARLDAVDMINGNLPYAALACRAEDARQEKVWGYLVMAVREGVSLDIAEGFDSPYTSLLGLAAENGYYLAAEYLVKSCGFDVNAAVNVGGKTPLMIAMENREYETFDTLLDLGAKTTVRDALGHDVRYYAKILDDQRINTILRNP